MADRRASAGRRFYFAARSEINISIRWGVRDPYLANRTEVSVLGREGRDVAVVGQDRTAECKPDTTNRYLGENISPTKTHLTTV